MSVEMTLKVLSEEGDYHKYLEWPEGVRIPVEGEGIVIGDANYLVVEGAVFFLGEPTEVALTVRRV